MNRRRLYILIITGCLMGYSWLAFSSYYYQNEVSVCLLKHVTGVPCPSCGSTRAILMLIDGDIVNSLKLNPFGILLFTIMLLVPIWLFIDFLLKKSSLLRFYIQSEKFIRKKQVAIPLASLVLGNWIWNILKYIQ